MSVPILRRDELLDIAKLSEVFNSAGDKTVARIELLAQARDNKLPLAEFKQLLKSAETKPVITLDRSVIPKSIVNIPDEYSIADSGITLYAGRLQFEVCPHPIFPVEILRDIETGEEKIRVAFKRFGKWNHDIIVNRYDIATCRNIVKLTNYGILVNDENARYLVKFFCDIEKLNETTLKATPATASLGWSDYGFLPYTENVVYNYSNTDNARRYKLYREHGDYNVWLMAQNTACKYGIPRIMIAAGYASILLENFGINPFGVHLYGETGLGKSVSILASASIYGYPDIKNGIVYTGNSTANGLESRLAFVKNAAFYLDELSMLSSEQINAAIYLIMQGQGKVRMNRNAQAQSSYYWNCVSVSSSELPVTNDTSRGGIYNRIIQLPSEDRIFGNTDLKFISQIFLHNYGFGAPLFVKLLERAEIQTEIVSLKRQYYSEIIPYTEDKQANAVSALLVAYELARKYIYKSEHHLTASDFIPFVATPDEISQTSRTYTKLIEWVTSNYKMFDESEIGNQQKWGRQINGLVHILPLRFTEFCKNNQVNERQFLTGMRSRGLLRHRPGELKNRYRLFGTGAMTVVSIVTDSNEFGTV